MNPTVICSICEPVLHVKVISALPWSQVDRNKVWFENQKSLKPSTV